MATVQPPAGRVYPSAGQIYAAYAARVYTRAAWGDAWAETPYLSCLRCTDTAAPSIPTATLEYKYGTILREGGADFAEVDPVELPGRFVQVRAVNDFGETPLWTGVIVDDTTFPHGGETAAGTQIFTAYGLALLLDRVQLDHGWIDSGGGLARIDRLPEFNARSRFGAHLSGNRSTAVVGSTYVFSDDGKVWTNHNVAEYLLGNYLDGTGLSVELSGKPAVLDRLVYAHDLAGKTVWQALSHLIPRRQGLVFSLRVDGDAVRLHLDTVIGAPVSVGDVTIPANGEVIDYDNDNILVEETRVMRSHATRYDTVVAEGGLIKSCFSVSDADLDLEAGWSTADETAYKAADDEQRKSSKYERVYRYFRVPDAWAGYAANGEAAGSSVALPSCDDDGGIRLATPAKLFRQGKAFERWLPIASPGAAEGEPVELARPFVAAYKPATSSSDAAWFLAHDGMDEPQISPAHVRMADGDLAFDVQSQINHVYGLNHITPDGSTDTTSQTQPATDWQAMIATVCLATDARLRVTATIPGGDPDRGRVLRMHVPDAELWYVVPGTVTGVSDGALVRDASGVVRNDADRLRGAAALAKAWYGTPRAALSTRWVGIPFVRPCQYVETARIPGYSGEIGTVVTSVAVDMSSAERGFRTTVETAYLELDAADAVDFPGLSNPAAVAKTILSMQDDLRDVRRHVGGLPGRAARPFSGTKILQSQISGGVSHLTQTFTYGGTLTTPDFTLSPPLEIPEITDFGKDLYFVYPANSISFHILGNGPALTNTGILEAYIQFFDEGGAAYSQEVSLGGSSHTSQRTSGNWIGYTPLIGGYSSAIEENVPGFLATNFRIIALYQYPTNIYSFTARMDLTLSGRWLCIIANNNGKFGVK